MTKAKNTKPPNNYRVATKDDLKQKRIKPGVLHWCSGYPAAIEIRRKLNSETTKEYEQNYKNVIKKYILMGVLYIKE